MDKVFGIAWENVFVGLFGALLVSLITLAAKYIQNKIIERKFPLAGEYITKFEDEKDGQKIECTAPATLKQKGRKITGTTFMPEDDRTWIIEGEAISTGHIYGVYFAEDPIDKGIGNFFLKVDNKRNMFGVWSGYDSANGKITSGKYIFHPVYRKFEITDLQKEYIPQLLDISDQVLGKDYLKYEDLEKVLNNQEEYMCKIVLNTKNRKVIGFCLCLIVTPEILPSILKMPKERIPGALRHSEKIGVLKTTAIAGEYQGHGIGKKLTDECYRTMLKSNVQSICSVAWKNGDRINIGGILDSLGFKKYTEIENYWKDDSLKNGYACPVCGKPPCLCSAVIYTQSVYKKKEKNET